jgi:WD40 repeat protein
MLIQTKLSFVKIALVMFCFAISMKTSRSILAQNSSVSVAAIAWSPDGAKLAVGYDTGKFEILDAVSMQTLWQVSPDAGTINSIAWNNQGNRIAIGYEIGTVDIWDILTKTIVAQVGNNEMHEMVRWSPDGKKLAATYYTNNVNGVRIWDTTTWNLLVTLQGENGNIISALGWSPDSGELATGSQNTNVVIWNASNANILATLSVGSTDSSDYAIDTVVWSPDSTHIATEATGQVVRVWGSATQQIILSTVIPEATDLDWSPDSKMLVISTLHDIEILNSISGQILQKTPISSEVLKVVWQPQGTRIAYGGVDGIVHIVQYPPVTMPTPSTIPNNTATLTSTVILTNTTTSTLTSTNTPTPTDTATFTLTSTATVTNTSTPTNTLTSTLTPTTTLTPTPGPDNIWAHTAIGALSFNQADTAKALIASGAAGYLLGAVM